jgi:hypothetical protein
MRAVVVTAAMAFALGAPAKGADLCALVSKAEVSQALRVAIVRAAASDTELGGCDFSIKSTPAAASTGHAVDLAKSAAQANGTQLDDATQKLLATFANGVFQGSDSEKSAAANARHPGEVAVFSFVVLPGDANDQMRATRAAHSGIAPVAVTTIANLGDEAFDSGGAMLSVRKGKRMIQFTYPSCACTTKDIVPLARKVVSGL